jgi:hypothetical protein
MALAILRPKRLEWFRRSLAAAVVSVVVYLGWSWWSPWAPGGWGGLTFGTIAAVIFLIDALYPLRRRLQGWPFGTAQRWLQFHIYGGVLACLFVLIHMGFRLPGGQFGWWLLIFSLWTTLSGLAGVYLQKSIPAEIAGNLAVEAIYERIPEHSSRLQGEADKLLAGAPELLQRFYLTDVRPSLGALMPSWSYLADFRAERERRLNPFRDVVQYLSGEDRARLTDLQAIVSEKMELDVQYSLQRILKVWVPLHAVPGILLMGLLAVHIAAVWLF